MSGFTGFMVYFIGWWTVLFAVLPFGVRPDPDATTGGWRGTPVAPRFWRTVIWTTVITTILWLGIYALVSSDSLSFREGWLALPAR